jgi:peptidoglycan/LPS O-acetylase OafA/YrhL
MRGIVERSLWHLGVALVVGLLYGWQLVLLLPTDEQVSWQGHLFGFVGGLVAAVVFRRRRAVVPDSRPAAVVPGVLPTSPPPAAPYNPAPAPASSPETSTRSSQT